MSSRPRPARPPRRSSARPGPRRQQSLPAHAVLCTTAARSGRAGSEAATPAMPRSASTASTQPRAGRLGHLRPPLRPRAGARRMCGRWSSALSSGERELCRCSTCTGARRRQPLARRPPPRAGRARHCRAAPGAAATHRFICKTRRGRQAFSFPLVSVAAARRGDDVSLVQRGWRTSRARSTRPDPLAGLPGNPQSAWKRTVLATLVERSRSALSAPDVRVSGGRDRQDVGDVGSRGPAGAVLVRLPGSSIPARPLQISHGPRALRRIRSASGTASTFASWAALSARPSPLCSGIRIQRTASPSRCTGGSWPAAAGGPVNASGPFGAGELGSGPLLRIARAVVPSRPTQLRLVGVSETRRRGGEEEGARQAAVRVVGRERMCGGHSGAVRSIRSTTLQSEVSSEARRHRVRSAPPARPQVGDARVRDDQPHVRVAWTRAGEVVDGSPRPP